MKIVHILCLLCLTGTAYGQGCNPAVPGMGSNTSWAQGANVHVQLFGFNSTQTSGIIAVLNAWQNAGNSGVTFTVVSSYSSGVPYMSISNQVPPQGSTYQGSTGGISVGNNRDYATVSINPGITNPTAFQHTVSHEVGHSMGLADCPACAQGTSAMTLPTSGGLNGAGGSTTPTTCDKFGVNANAAGKYPAMTPPCTPQGQPPCPTCTCTWNTNTCQYDCNTTPIVIDLAGNGFNLTNAANGVNFDIDGDGYAQRLGWTSTNSDDAWLFLDRNGNGVVDDGTELFGNFTPQPPPPSGEEKNGFLALAVFDRPANGGNNDGEIDAQDSVFSALRLWRDINHNGICSPGELRTLPYYNVIEFDLDYRESRYVDHNGNRFKYRARVRDGQRAHLGRWAWDVFLVNGN